ncbi:hypothetical protein [Herbidospora daliensis]|uniref:hypothetical protein n=1 Tax=Herbidospora daliensis TaxID=295585 RepID=UPI000780843D|nr:hypothetical protein [Herbidospora daliensis]
MSGAQPRISSRGTFGTPVSAADHTVDVRGSPDGPISPARNVRSGVIPIRAVTSCVADDTYVFAEHLSIFAEAR